MLSQVPFFIASCWLLAMVPGAGQALMLRQTLALGRRTAMVTALGNSTGIVIWSAAAGLGLSAILLANPDAYLVIRLVGASVLGVLGILTLNSVRKERDLRASAAPSRGSGRAAFLAGLGTNLGNPKAGVFAISLLPQFITRGSNFALASTALGVIWATTSFSWYLTFTWMVEKGRTFVTRRGVRQALDALTGITLIALGLIVAIGV